MFFGLVNRASGPAKAIETSLGGIDQTAKGLTSTLGANSNAQKGVAAALKSSTGATKQNTSAQGKLASSWQHALGVGRRYGDMLKRNTGLIQQQEKASKKLSDARNKFDQGMARSAAMSFAGSQSTQVGSKLLNPFTGAIREAGCFEAAMDKVQSKTGATTVEMKMLTNQARLLGKTTWASSSEVAGGQSYLAQAGFGVTEIHSAMPGLLNLARSDDSVGLAEASDIASNVMSGFGLKATEMGRIGNVLASTAATSNTNLHQLGEAMSYAAPVAKNLGVSIEETAAMIGLLGNSGIQSSRAGTTMSAAFSRLSSPAGEASKALKTLGVDAVDSSGNMRNTLDIFADLAKATEKMGSGKRMSFLTDIFGREHAGSISQLIESQGSGGITAYKKQIQEMSANDQVNWMAGIMDDNLPGDLKTLSSAMESVSITMGQLFLPMARKFTKGVTGVVRFVDKAINKFPILGYVIGGVGLAIGGILVVAGMLITTLAGVGAAITMTNFGLTAMSTQLPLLTTRMGIMRGRVIATARSFWTSYIPSLKAANTSSTGFFSRIPGLASGAIGKLGGVGSAMRGVAVSAIPMLITGIKGLGVSIMTIPGIGWILAAITAVAFLVWKYWGPIKSFVSGLWNGLVDGLQPVISALKPVGSMLKKNFSKILIPLKLTFAPLYLMFRLLKALFKPIHGANEGAKGLGYTFGSQLAKSIKFIGTLIKWAFKLSPVGLIINAFRTAHDLLTKPLPQAIKGIKNRFGALGRPITFVLGKLNFLLTPIKLLWSWLQKLKDFLSNSLSTAIDGLKSKFDLLAHPIKSAKSWVGSLFGDKDEESPKATRPTKSRTNGVRSVAAAVALAAPIPLAAQPAMPIEPAAQSQAFDLAAKRDDFRSRIGKAKTVLYVPTPGLTQPIGQNTEKPVVVNAHQKETHSKILERNNSQLTKSVTSKVTQPKIITAPQAPRPIVNVPQAKKPLTIPASVTNNHRKKIFNKASESKKTFITYGVAPKSNAIFNATPKLASIPSKRQGKPIVVNTHKKETHSKILERNNSQLTKSVTSKVTQPKIITAPQAPRPILNVPQQIQAAKKPLTVPISIPSPKQAQEKPQTRWATVKSTPMKAAVKSSGKVPPINITLGDINVDASNAKDPQAVANAIDAQIKSAVAQAVKEALSRIGVTDERLYDV